MIKTKEAFFADLSKKPGSSSSQLYCAVNLERDGFYLRLPEGRIQSDYIKRLWVPMYCGVSKDEKESIEKDLENDYRGWTRIVTGDYIGWYSP